MPTAMIELPWALKYKPSALTTHFYANKQFHFRPAEPQIFVSNLASNFQASNRKFLAIFQRQIGNF